MAARHAGRAPCRRPIPLGACLLLPAAHPAPGLAQPVRRRAHASECSAGTRARGAAFHPSPCTAAYPAPGLVQLVFSAEQKSRSSCIAKAVRSLCLIKSAFLVALGDGAAAPPASPRRCALLRAASVSVCSAARGCRGGGRSPCVAEAARLKPRRSPRVLGTGLRAAAGGRAVHSPCIHPTRLPPSAHSLRADGVHAGARAAGRGRCRRRRARRSRRAARHARAWGWWAGGACAGQGPHPLPRCVPGSGRAAAGGGGCSGCGLPRLPRLPPSPPQTRSGPLSIHAAVLERLAAMVSLIEQRCSHPALPSKQHPFALQCWSGWRPWSASSSSTTTPPTAAGEFGFCPQLFFWLRSLKAPRVANRAAPATPPAAAAEHRAACGRRVRSWLGGCERAPAAPAAPITGSLPPGLHCSWSGALSNLMEEPAHRLRSPPTSFPRAQHLLTLRSWSGALSNLMEQPHAPPTQPVEINFFEINLSSHCAAGAARCPT